MTGDLELLGHLRRPTADDLLPDLLQHNVIPASGSGMVMETELALDLGGYDERLRASEDWDMAVRLALSAPAAVADGPHVAYRIYAGSMSSSAPRMRASFEAMRERYRNLAAEHGVELDETAYETFLAQQEVKAGRRLGGAKAYCDLARLEGDPRHLGRAALAMVAPTVLDRIGDARAVKRIPARWAALTEDWVARVPRATGAGLVPVD